MPFKDMIKYIFKDMIRYIYNVDLLFLLQRDLFFLLQCLLLLTSYRGPSITDYCHNLLICHEGDAKNMNFWISFGAPSRNVPICKKNRCWNFDQFGQKLEVASELWSFNGKMHCKEVTFFAITEVSTYVLSIV